MSRVWINVPTATRKRLGIRWTWKWFALEKSPALPETNRYIAPRPSFLPTSFIFFKVSNHWFSGPNYWLTFSFREGILMFIGFLLTHLGYRFLFSFHTMQPKCRFQPFQRHVRKGFCRVSNFQTVLVLKPFRPSDFGPLHGLPGKPAKPNTD